MEDTTISIIGIVVAVIMMLIVPLILISDRSDDISQLVIQTVTAEFVDEVIKTGKITDESYQKYRDSLYSTGNTYEIDMQIKILDENQAKQVTVKNKEQVGKNAYYSIFTSQLESMMEKKKKIVLKQGDAISITVKNSSKTLSQSLKSFYSGIGGENSQIIAATASGTIAINGKM